ncbi:MAG: hypothetical protein DDT19_00213 [Syntrophomonadaceae bacterium]|nr:hypothetical protein [Bacillota bacterium]
MKESLDRRLLELMLRKWVEARLEDLTGEKGRMTKAADVPSYEARAYVLELLGKVVEDLRKAEQDKAS